MDIKILGKGCKSCRLLEKNVKKAVEEMGVEATFDKVTDIVEIAEHGVMKTPGLVVDGVVKSSGKVLSISEIKDLLSG